MSAPAPKDVSKDVSASQMPPPAVPNRPLGSFRSEPSGASSSKAIGSQAKKPDDATTRTGKPKMTFVPTIAARKKKIETEVKPEPGPAEGTRGRGRGRGGERGGGRGRGRGAPGGFGGVEMTASGPFALGPAQSATAGRRIPQRVGLGGHPGGSGINIGQGSSASTHVRPQRTALGGVGGGLKEEEPDQYSDPDEPWGIVDMADVKTLDWMAPETLKRVKEEKTKKDKKDNILKDTIVKSEQAEEPDLAIAEEHASTTLAADQKDMANALDLSESEEEEELEDVIEDFISVPHEGADADDPDLSQDNRLYFFQFPSPFPKFLPAPVVIDLDSDTHMADAAAPTPPDKGKGKETDSARSKSVSFAPETKPEAKPSPTSESDAAKNVPLDGIIGRLEIYRSGIVKMILGDNIVLDVSAATQPSFLQHAIYVDQENKQLKVLGAVNRRFVVSPDVEHLLDDIEAKERAKKEAELNDGLISMDID